MKTLKEWRETAEATVEEMAKAIGTKRETVCRWEAGTTSPTPKQMVKILKFYGSKGIKVDIDSFVFF